MNYKKILKSLTANAPRDYAPEFSLQPGHRCWHIFDGDQAVLDFYVPDENTPGERYALDIFKFSPLEDAIIVNNPDPKCQVSDMHTLKNSCITFPYFYSKDLIEGVDNPHLNVRMEWVSDSGEKLHAKIIGDFPEEQRFTYEIIIDYDPTRVQYRFQFKIDYWKLAPMGFEPLNFLMAGALRGTKELNRWSHSIYEDRFNNLRKIVHSNALFCATDYSEPPYWRHKSAPLRGAWIAYGCDPVCNPAFLIRDNNVTLQFDTCSALFDEHIIFNDATNENLDENHFHFSMNAEFVNLEYDVAKKLLDSAQPQPIPRKWRINKVALPLWLDRLNDFETPLDVSLPEECPIIVAEMKSDAPVQWVSNTAFKGDHSLKLFGENFVGWTEAYPEGAVCEVEPHSKYKLSAMVKCVGVERFARIALSIFEYHPYNRLDTAVSAKIGGDEEWTHLEVVLDVGVAPYVLPLFQLYGKGEAYFDQVKLEKY